MLGKLADIYDSIFDFIKQADFLAPLAMRIYLFFPFWMAGLNKLADMDSTINWFGNAEWGLGLPAPELLAWLATLTEVFGAIFLLLGFAVRFISIPLMITMIVAAVTVHWDNGWFAIAQSAAPELNGLEIETAVNEDVKRRVGAAREILREHGNYDWLTAKGSFVILQNGVEFAVTYFIMLLSLLFTGAGRYVSVDYWIKRYAKN